MLEIVKKVWRRLFPSENIFLIVSGVGEVERWAFYGNALQTREWSASHARYWPYGLKVQEYFAEIQRAIEHREKYRRKHLDMVALLDKDIALLTKTLPKRLRVPAEESPE